MTDSNTPDATPRPRARAASAAPAGDAPAAAAPVVTPDAAPAEPKKKSNAAPIVAALAVGALLGGASGAGVAAGVVSANQTATVTPATPQTITVNDTDHVNAVTAVAAKASPSVVTVSVSGQSAGGTGSGIVLSSDGYILTNTHVVTLDGASANNKVEVTTYDGKLYKAKVVGMDPIVDLAVIKLEGAGGLQPIDFADSNNLNVGDQAIAIGAPLGLSNTVTDGIISALNRSIQIASSAVPNDTSQQDGNNGQGGNGNGGDSGPFDFWNFGQSPGGTTT
ncbi:MAG TPA: trypsin-like peptidase domain-containing protein, partial [Pseudolysinimonas sp.]|nr:trypsin-like peptidase domain-containing protein [Pseudolysinimonas sp.]